MFRHTHFWYIVNRKHTTVMYAYYTMAHNFFSVIAGYWGHISKEFPILRFVSSKNSCKNHAVYYLHLKKKHALSTDIP